jgi:hypothetical protein
MDNPYRGDVALIVNGEALPMRLTLGALAALEAKLESDSLIALIERYESDRFRSADIVALLIAGLHGAGWQGSAEDLMSAQIEGGPMEAARRASLLLKRAFTAPE